MAGCRYSRLDETRNSKNGGSPAQIKKLADEWLAINQPQFDQWVATASKAQ
jgi:glycine betaine/proline transport system substrate-binding protein